MVTQPIVFVGGIHGAGKTTVSRRLAVALSASHVTAGSLIRKTSTSEIIVTGVGNKAVPDVTANQALLMRGLAQYRRHAGGPIILDGHFSLMDPNGVPVAIPMAVYLAIAPVAVVLIESESEVVYSRLLQRDGAAPPLESIPPFSERERAHAQAVSTALNVPMFVVRGDLPADGTFNTVVSGLLPLVRGAT